MIKLVAHFFVAMLFALQSMTAVAHFESSHPTIGLLDFHWLIEHGLLISVIAAVAFLTTVSRLLAAAKGNIKTKNID